MLRKRGFRDKMAVILRGVIRFYYFLRAKYGYGRNAKNSTSSRGCDLQMNIEICSQCKQLKSFGGRKKGENFHRGCIYMYIAPPASGTHNG
ncbi:hypothetical protein CDAR_428881 [Caerostris darwini]|uniref:Uncharacterized protein n=1 Tax=Caerostris darwini TaxID=1538125 RepID=A0AAV4V512_9ARAC|nr:hypothetical protein CDAR_428881 [Caerostris darwini]